MTEIRYFEVHAFSDPDIPFSGNPAGVCLLDTFPDDNTLLGIAASNNLSETAFVVPTSRDVWDLRWFTPALEVDLCGHATLAAAASLFHSGAVTGDTAHFDSRSGRLTVTRTENGFAMNFPAIGWHPADPSPAIADALGLTVDDLIEVHDIERIHGARYQMWVVNSEETVRGLDPDHGGLRRENINVIVTARGETGADFVSRFFAPASGVDEDPVTGSAHCTLAPYWAKALNKAKLQARQIGPRPGALQVGPEDGRVTLSGNAPIFLEGRIRL